jgi:hypothetical protein
VQGLIVHPRDNDLVIATHGRAGYVLDDIRPLRTLSAATMAKPLHFFEVPPAQAYTTRQKEGSRVLGDAEFRGENEPYGALLTYSLNFAGLPHPIEAKERERKEKERAAALKTIVSESGVPTASEDMPKEPVKTTQPPTPKPDDKAPEVDIEVADSSGKVIRKFKGPAKLGVNRTAWDLTRDAFKRPKNPNDEGNEFRQQTGPEVPPGLYVVTIKFRDQEAKQSVHVVADPREQFTDAARQAKYDAILRAGKLQEQASEAIERIQKTRADIDTAVAKLKKEDEKEPSAIARSGTALKAKLDAVEKRLWTPPNTKGIVAETDVLSKIGYPLNALQSSWDAPTPSQLEYLARAESLLREVLADFNALYAGDVAQFREAVRKENVVLLPEYPPL